METGAPLFNGPVASYDKNKIHFIHFLLLYHRLNELEDRPQDYIIDSDVLLDQWLIDRKNKKEMEQFQPTRQLPTRHGNQAGSKSGVVDFR